MLTDTGCSGDRVVTSSRKELLDAPFQAFLERIMSITLLAPDEAAWVRFKNLVQEQKSANVVFCLDRRTKELHIVELVEVGALRLRACPESANPAAYAALQKSIADLPPDTPLLLAVLSDGGITTTLGDFRPVFRREHPTVNLEPPRQKPRGQKALRVAP